MAFLRPGSIVLFLSLLCGGAFGQSVTCPDGFVAPPPNLYTGYCYRYITATQTWNAHENDCSRVTYNGLPYAGGHLATLFDTNSAMVVMNNYCNNLNQGQSHYFVGYYCVSSSYSSRTDWRWSSGMPTTWLHNSPTYLSGAEPDDAGCGRAHYSDDGANTGRIGDWTCSSPLSGGCCEAPVVPTPSASTTGTQSATSTITSTNTRSNTPTQTATETVTSSSTQTGTQTSTVTMTRTSSKSSTETRTSTMTSTATMTATSTGTSTVSPSETSSSSVSVSVSASTSTSVSPSQTSSSSSSVTATITASASVSPSFTKIRAMWFPQSGLNNGGNGGNSAMYLDENGVWVEDTSLANEGGTQDKIGAGVIIGAAVGAGLCLCCCLMGALWFCIARRRKRENERKARERLNRKSHMVVASTIKRGGGATSVASTLGVQSVRANGPAMMAMFNSMNPALIKARRGTVVGGGGYSGSGNATGRHRNPRMTTALAAFKPTMISKEGGGGGFLQELPEIQEEPLVEDAVIGIDEQEDAREVEEVGVIGGGEETGEVEGVGGSGEVGQVDGQKEDVVEDDDYVDEDDAMAAGVGRKINDRSVANSNSLQHKQKNGVEMAAAPPLEEARKLVIGKGAVMKEHVQKQTVMLRRVSKVRGDKELTALRQETVRFARPSMAGRGLYEPQASHRNLLGGGNGGAGTPYAFTATVSRVIVKEEKEDA